MKTFLEIVSGDTTYTYDEIECPPLPEGTLIACPKVAAARIVYQLIYITHDDEVKQRCVAK